MIPQIEPSFGEEERKAVSDYMATGAWLTEFEKTREFERQIATFVGAKHCFVVPNCTLALYAAYYCLGIGIGDEVIVPAYTMMATANAITMLGAWLTFVDVSGDFCLDLKAAEKAITKYTKAVVVVSLNGRSSNMEAARTVADSHSLYLIEDAAQALGSRWQSKHLGTFGHVGCYSFSPHKIISTGQGGCIVTDDDEIAERIHRFRNFGRSGAGGHDHDVFGINLKFTDLQAVVGLEQLKKLPARIEFKKRLYRMYQEQLTGLPIQFPPTDLRSVTPWYVDILVPNREELATCLRANGIGTQFTYPVVPHTGTYSQSERYPMAERIAHNGLWLPSSVTLTDENVEYICSAIRAFYS